MSGIIPGGRAESLADLLALQPNSIASRVIARSPGGNVTLFTMDAGEGLSEHTTPFDALVVVLEGAVHIQVGEGSGVVRAGQVLRMPANVPHALKAEDPARMLLVMLK